MVKRQIPFSKPPSSGRYSLRTCSAPQPERNSAAATERVECGHWCHATCEITPDFAKYDAEGEPGTPTKGTRALTDEYK
jgi:hypothetical protein